MIDLLKRFLIKHERKDIRSHEQATPHDIHIATCALLIEMANIDGEFNGSEKSIIIEALKDNYQISEAEIDKIIKTSEEELAGNIDLWQFTNLINQNYSLEDKILIIETVWRIAGSDGKIDKHEDYLVHKLADLLRLSHKQLINAKLKVLHR